MGMREAELVRRAQGGDTQAFAALVTQHQLFVYNLALRATGDAREAEDVTQEAFLRAWRALPQFRRRARFRTWLYRIVMNLCYSRMTRLKREWSMLGEDEANTIPDHVHADPAVRVECRERRAFLHRQIDLLPDKYRVLIQLRYQQGLPYDEIAAILNLPLGTVKTGISRARERLREALREYEE